MSDLEYDTSAWGEIKADVYAGEPCGSKPEKYIDTKSNLNSEVLKDITLKVDIDYSLFELKENMIDEKFLGLRNKICHGDRVTVTESEFESLYVEVIGLVDLFKNQVINSIYTKSFLKKVV